MQAGSFRTLAARLALASYGLSWPKSIPREQWPSSLKDLQPSWLRVVEGLRSNLDCQNYESSLVRRSCKRARTRMLKAITPGSSLLLGRIWRSSSSRRYRKCSRRARTSWRATPLVPWAKRRKPEGLRRSSWCRTSLFNSQPF